MSMNSALGQLGKFFLIKNSSEERERQAERDRQAPARYSAAARNLAQEVIERVLSGDRSARLKLMGSTAFQFGSIQSIEVCSVTPSSVMEPASSRSIILISLRVRGSEAQGSRVIERFVKVQAVFQDGRGELC